MISVNGHPVVVWSHITLSFIMVLVPRCFDCPISVVLGVEQARRTA